MSPRDREQYASTLKHPDELRPEQRERMCPSCKVRYAIGKPVNPNFDTLPIDRLLWQQLRSAAESFDQAISTVGNPDGTGEDTYGGSGDGRRPFTATQFVEWIKGDCAGFRGKGHSVLSEFDGVRDGQLDWLPQGSGGSRSTKGRAA